LLASIEKTLLVFAGVLTIALFIIVAPILSLYIIVPPQEYAVFFGSNAQIFVVARKALMTSITAATAATLSLLALGIPSAYVLARAEFPGKRVIEAIIDIPLLIPHIVVGIILLLTFGPRGPINLHIMDTFNGVVLAMMYVSLPIMFDTLKIGFKTIDEELELVARSLGASKIKAFTTITLPLIKRNILAGSLLTWARAMSEVGSILIIAYYPKTINIVILEAFQTYGLKYAAILSAVLITISLTVFIALRMVYRE